MDTKHDHVHDQHCGCGATYERVDLARRRLLASAAGATIAGAAGVSGTALAATDNARALYADPDQPGLPQIDMVVDPGRTALVVTDPQIDFLSEKGVTWGGRR